MARNKEQGLKDFLITKRKQIKASVSSSPVWVIQKAGKRFWNKKGKRTWKDIELGHLYRKKVHKAKRIIKSGKKPSKKNRKFAEKRKNVNRRSF